MTLSLFKNIMRHRVIAFHCFRGWFFLLFAAFLHTIFRSTTIFDDQRKLPLFDVPGNVELVDTPMPTKFALQQRATNFSTTRYSTNLSETQQTQQNIQRGMNILNAKSGCSIAAWVYNGGPEVKHLLDDCYSSPKAKQLSRRAKTRMIQNGDTIYVPLIKLEFFVKQFLPYLRKEIVLISSQWQSIKELFENATAISNAILNNQYVLHWFCKDIGIYAPKHEKVSPFPIGLKPFRPNATLDFLNPIPEFRRMFLKAQMINKTRFIYAGFLRRTSPSRKHLVTTAKTALPYGAYLREIAKSKYILSPNGDHPDCHRHYEAIGLGTVPITELDQSIYTHLKAAPVVYNNSNWNITELEQMLSPVVHVNRNMVFEEYWIEYVEQTVGRELRWWDVNQNKRVKLSEFQMSRKNMSHTDNEAIV